MAEYPRLPPADQDVVDQCRIPRGNGCGVHDAPCFAVHDDLVGDGGHGKAGGRGEDDAVPKLYGQFRVSSILAFFRMPLNGVSLIEGS